MGMRFGIPRGEREGGRREWEEQAPSPPTGGSLWLPSSEFLLPGERRARWEEREGDRLRTWKKCSHCES